MRSLSNIRLVLIPLLALATFKLAGCSPAVVLRPIYDDSSNDKALADVRVEGQWTTPDLEESGSRDEIQIQWNVESNQAYPGTYYVSARFYQDEEKRDEAKPEYLVRFVAIEGMLFFDAKYINQEFGQTTIRASQLAPGVAPGHLVGSVWIEKDFLHIVLLDSEWVMQNLPGNLWVMLDVSGTEVAAISAPVEDVRRLLVTHSEDPFGLAFYFCRPGVACAEKVYEDLLARHPNDESVLSAAGEFYLRQGNYARGVTLLQRYAEREPKDASRKKGLAIARLLNRDFRGAQDEFAAAQQLDPHNSCWREIFLSYFLEENYSAAVDTFAHYRGSEERIPAEIILLDYLSLSRLGRATEAQTMLENEALDFHVPAEKLFSLPDSRFWFTSRLGGRENPSLNLALFAAMHWEAKGDRGKAADRLRKLIEEGERDDLLYLTAMIELERLNARPAP